MVSVSCCFSEKLQTIIIIFSKKPNQIESQYFHQHQILRLFTVCMKPWWNQGLSYSYDKPCRQHSKPINFDKSWNIFLNSKYCLCHKGVPFKSEWCEPNVEIFLSSNWWNIFQTTMMKFFCEQTDEIFLWTNWWIFLWPNWWNIFVTKLMNHFKLKCWTFLWWD